MGFFYFSRKPFQNWRLAAGRGRIEIDVGKVEGDEKRIEIGVGKVEGGEKRIGIGVGKVEGGEKRIGIGVGNLLADIYRLPGKLLWISRVRS